MTPPLPAEAPDRPAAEERPREGPGTSTLASLWTLYALTFRQHLHGRRWMVMGVLFLLPVVLALVIRFTAPDAPAIWIEFLLAFMFIPQALLPLVALVYASGIIQDEQEEQTLTYLLVRPIPRWAIYVVKLVATLTTTILLTILFTTLTYVAIYVGGSLPLSEVAGRCLRAIAVHALAVTVYCCLFGVMSLVTRYALIVGILYTGIFEGLLANLPFGVRLITVIYYTRLIAYRSMSFVDVSPAGRKEDIAAMVWKLDIKKDPDLLEHPTIRTSLLVLLGVSVVFSIIAAVICARREFHVKTPEAA
jgi:ABC-2 type transport system permease protein